MSTVATTSATIDQPKIVIAFYSGWGHTAALAEAVAEGARQGNAAVTMIPVGEPSDADWATLDAADAIVFGTPTYMGNVAAGFQRFAEMTSKRCVRGEWRDKIAAGFVNSGAKSGDKLHALTSLSVLAAQHHMHWVNLGLGPGWSASTDSENDLNRLGFFLGAGAQTDTDVAADRVHPADVRTCQHLGRRVAEVTAQMVAGRLATRAAAAAAS
jgi:multimeric flavodoxin WrbA